MLLISAVIIGLMGFLALCALYTTQKWAYRIGHEVEAMNRKFDELLAVMKQQQGVTETHP
jgi:hypothetical protein